MVQIEPDGRLAFSLAASETTEAREVLLVGAFHGWHLERIPLERTAEGGWIVQLDVPPGEYLYQFQVDGEARLDAEAHGQRLGPDGRPWSRAWRPNFAWAEAGVPWTGPDPRPVADAA
jgi:1,4-alpha-glucan branching enzyme